MKIRGVRVEPEEVEAVLRRREAIRDSVEAFEAAFRYHYATSEEILEGEILCHDVTCLRRTVGHPALS